MAATKISCHLEMCGSFSDLAELRLSGTPHCSAASPPVTRQATPQNHRTQRRRLSRGSPTTFDWLKMDQVQSQLDLTSYLEADIRFSVEEEG